MSQTTKVGPCYYFPDQNASLFLLLVILHLCTDICLCVLEVDLKFMELFLWIYCKLYSLWLLMQNIHE